jgi:hypothetical protein
LQLSESIEQWLISLLYFLDFPAVFDVIARHGDARSTELQSIPAARRLKRGDFNRTSAPGGVRLNHRIAFNLTPTRPQW